MDIRKNVKKLLKSDEKFNEEMLEAMNSIAKSICNRVSMQELIMAKYLSDEVKNDGNKSVKERIKELETKDDISSKMIADQLKLLLLSDLEKLLVKSYLEFKKKK